MGYYLSSRSLENLKKYKYSGVDKSILSYYVLNPFWTWFVTLWPKWVAPNTITLTGLAVVGLNFLTLVYYDPAFRAERAGADGPPNWVYYTWAFGLFFYQTLDSIDGKQARRTGMAGPLGQMFDHGCDAINTTLEVLLSARALNLGRSRWTVASEVATMANFYLTTWEEFHTGTLYLGYFSGPVEGILMIVCIYLISGTYGPEVWDTKILTFTHLDQLFPELTKLVPNIGLNEAFMVFGGLALGYNIIGSYTNVYHARLAQHLPVLPPLLGLLPFILTTLLHLSWLLPTATKPPLILQSPRFLPFMCAWGLQMSRQVGKLILMHLTDNPFPYVDGMWIWTAVCALDANAQAIFGRPPLLHSTPTLTTLTVVLTLLFSLGLYVRFCTLVIWDITEYLGIACFNVQRKNADGEWKPADEVGKKAS